MYVCHVCAYVLRGQKRASDYLEVEVTDSCEPPMWVLKNKPMSSAMYFQIAFENKVGCIIFHDDILKLNLVLLLC